MTLARITLSFPTETLLAHGDVLRVGMWKVDIVVTFSDLSLPMVKNLCGVLGVIFMAYGFYSLLHAYRSRPTIMLRKA